MPDNIAPCLACSPKGCSRVCSCCNVAVVLMQKKEELGLPASQRCVLLLDCWYGHIDVEFRKFVRENFPWLLILYVPANCTSKLQPCDLALNRTVKNAAAEAFAEDMADALGQFSGTAEERTHFVRALLATRTLKPRLAIYVRAGLEAVQEQQESIAKAWDTAGWLQAWEPQFQVGQAAVTEQSHKLR